MEFGRVDPKQLSSIKFNLPEDAQRTQKVLSKKSASRKIYVGCAKWGIPAWVGKIYPKGTKAADFLEVYASQFNCIELNAVFYKLPEREQVQNWKSKVDKDFKFCPKFTEVITHRKRLKNVDREVDAFLEVMSAFDKNLGPVFLMPHPQTGPKRIEEVLNFLEKLPKDMDLFLELRHPDWFKGESYKPVYDYLQKRKWGTVLTDTAGRRDCLHMELTNKETFIRFVGNSLHKSDYKRVDQWAERLKDWYDRGLKSSYFFMHQHEELYSPELAKYLIQKLNKQLEMKIKEPEFVTVRKGSVKST